jgi:hypothetical protein
MSDIWIGTGIWAGWRLTTDHSSSSYGQPVLVDPDGNAYGPGDIRKRIYQADYARELGVTPGAITGRIKRGTLPEFDGVDEYGRSYWYASTLENGKGACESEYRVVCSNGWSDTIYAKNDIAAKKAASKLLAFGCGDMSLYREDGSLVGTRRFWQNLNRFGWRPWA